MGFDRHFPEALVRVIKNGETCAAAPHKLQTRKIFHYIVDDLHNVDFLNSKNINSCEEALLYVFEDSEAVIKMITRGR